MRTPLLVCILLSAAAARAEMEPTTSEPENMAVLTPLGVRDPSALVMRPFNAPAVTIFPATTRSDHKDGSKVEVKRKATDKEPLRPGKRAVSLSVEEYQLLDIRPGDRVDVVAVFDAAVSSGTREAFAAMMLQNARVLSVATTGDLSAKGVLTLELNPIEAQYALLAGRRAELGIAVRAPGNAESHPIETATFGKLFR